MALQVNEQIQTNALYQAFRDRVEQEILADLRESLRVRAEPVLREAAKNAASALEASIVRQADHMSNEMVHVLSLRINGEQVSFEKKAR